MFYTIIDAKNIFHAYKWTFFYFSKNKLTKFHKKNVQISYLFLRKKLFFCIWCMQYELKAHLKSQQQSRLQPSCHTGLFDPNWLESGLTEKESEMVSSDKNGNEYCIVMVLWVLHECPLLDFSLDSSSYFIFLACLSVTLLLNI